MELESPTGGQSQALPHSTCILQQEEAFFSHPSMKKDFLLAKPYEKPLGFPCGLANKEPDCNAGDLGLISGLGRSPGERNGNPLQYSFFFFSFSFIYLFIYLFLFVVNFVIH